MKRTPLKRTPMKRSPRKAGPMPTEVYETVMRRAQGRCEAGIEGVCTGAPEDWHHRQRRMPGNDQVQNGLALCRACHHHITFISPALGKERGLVVSAFAHDYLDRPYYSRGHWWLLAEDGTKAVTTGPEVA